MEKGAQKQEIQSKKVEKRLLGKNFLLVKRTQLAASNENYDGFDKEIRSKGRTDAERRWWVSELLAANCEKAWIHAGWEDTLQKWYKWLEEIKKKDEKERMEEMHQHKVAQI